jgi:hypothetical protein
VIIQYEPNCFSIQGLQVLLFSREEEKIHIHVYCSDGEAKLWIFPEVSVAKNFGLSPSQIEELKRVVEEHKDEITNAWEKHFRG